MKKDKRINFKDLDQLIHSGQKEIKLEHDIEIESDEYDEYYEGIPLDIDNIIINAEGHYIRARALTRIFNIIGDNFTLKNIRLIGGYHVRGSAVIIDNESTGIFESCVFEENFSTYGGTIYNENASITLNDCKFNSNQSQRGAGITNYKGSLIVNNCEFHKNIAHKYGGAVYNGYGKIDIIDSSFSENYSIFDGGAISNYNGEVIIKDRLYCNPTF